jgi:hypothetical protein
MGRKADWSVCVGGIVGEEYWSWWDEKTHERIEVKGIIPNKVMLNSSPALSTPRLLEHLRIWLKSLGL